MAKKASEPSFKFWYDEKWYTEQGAKTILESGTKEDIATLRSEYTRMRDVAQKRLKRLGQTYSESQTYQQKQAGFAKLRDIDQRNLAKAFSELAKFVRASTSTVTGQRRAQEKTTATLNKAVGAGTDETGYTQAGVTKENYWRVIKILNKVRKLKVARVYGSDKIVTLAETTLGFTSDQFDKVLDNLETFLDNANSLQADLEMYIAQKNEELKESGSDEVMSYQKVDIDEFMEYLKD